MLINFASVVSGARIIAHSVQCLYPNDYAAAITPVLPHEVPSGHYAAANRPLPVGESEDWFEIDLGREHTIEELEVEWYAENEVGIEFLLEVKQHNAWEVCLYEDKGDLAAQKGLYRKRLQPDVTGQCLKFRLRKALGQNRLLIRRFSLLGPGQPPPHVLMIAPDCYMIDRRILQEARSLIQSGYRVTLLSGFECPQEAHYFQDGIEIHRYTYDWDDERLKRIRALLPKDERLQRWVNRVFMGVARRVLSWSPFDIFVLSKAQQFAADTIHVHDLPCLKYGVRLAAQRGIPLVFDAHEIYYEQEVLSPRRQRTLRREERHGIRHVNLFITVNEATADWYHQVYGIRPLVLMNCADTPAAGFALESNTMLREAAGLPAASRVVLYQGWISGERNLKILIQSAAYLPEDAYLVLIGYGEYEKELRAMTTGTKWHQKVRFLGRIEPEKILTFTAGADVGVIPYLPIDLNHHLCSPNKFFEYVQAGVPVVAHDLPFFRHMQKQYGVVLVGDLSTVNGMARVINGLLEAHESLASMRQACHQAAKKLNWEVEARKLLEAYAPLTRVRNEEG
jgi:glycosyltransferase involved in cell wall biosynthesis